MAKMIRALLSSKLLTIPTNTKIFGYASGSTTSLTDYTTSTSLSKTGAEWLAFVESITGWQCESYQAGTTKGEFNVFFEHSNMPNKFKIYDSSLANLLGFTKDVTYSKNANNEIVSSFWGAYKLVLGGSVYLSSTSILTVCKAEALRVIEGKILIGIGPVQDYIKAYDNMKYKLISFQNDLTKQPNLLNFLDYNTTLGIGETVTQINIPILAILGKTLKFGMFESHFKKDEFGPTSYEFSCLVMEV